ncbi:acyltransferase family protein [Candidatus Poribacteria bacterium]|nr:acyltransferase family protein [Candidatus Poribacteria bacterium]
MEIKPKRYYELDWIRVIVILNLIPFHAAWLLATVPGFSYNNTESLLARIMGVGVIFVNQWHMQLLFLVSGCSTFYSLKRRSNFNYIIERSKRLLVPLLLSVLIFIPLMIYFWPIPKGQERFFCLLYRNYLSALFSKGKINWFHLWFIYYLYIFSIISLPIFILIRKKYYEKFFTKLSEFSLRKGGIHLFGLPLGIIFGIIGIQWSVTDQISIPRLFSYILFFIYGFLICHYENFLEAVEKQRKLSLLLGIISFILAFSMLLLHRNNKGIMPLKPGYNSIYMLYLTLRGMNSWFWVLAFLGFSKRYLSFTNRFLQYFLVASYPIYIIHETLMIILGRYIIKLKTPLLFEFLLLCIVTFLVTIGIYELAIRRFNITRILFGMKKIRFN